MSIFSSNRERRLWLSTLVVVGAVYATLGLPSTLLVKFFKPDVFGAAFFVAFLLIWVAILTQGLKVRPGGLEIGLALGVAAAYLMVFARLGGAERSHMFEYCVIGAFIYEALTERASQGRRVFLPPLLAFVVTSLVGVIDEYIQVFLPNRVFDPDDIIVNTVSAFLAVSGMAVLGWARRWTRKIRRDRRASRDS